MIRDLHRISRCGHTGASAGPAVPTTTEPLDKHATGGTVSNFLTGASCPDATTCNAVGGSGASPTLNRTLVLTGSPLLPGHPPM